MPAKAKLTGDLDYERRARAAEGAFDDEPAEGANVAEGSHGGAGGGDEDGYDMTGASGPTTHRDVRNFLNVHTALGPTVTRTLLGYIDANEQREAQLRDLTAELTASRKGKDEVEAEYDALRERLDTLGAFRERANATGEAKPAERLTTREAVDKFLASGGEPAPKPAFAVGQRVKAGKVPPQGIYNGYGSVVEILTATTLPIRVRWDNGVSSNYAAVELEPADPAPPPPSPALLGPVEALRREIVKALREPGAAALNTVADKLSKAGRP